ncbi:PleD family two-component system response regulator [Roseobacter sp. HKCCD9026]|uniref:response regulator n=1 Tax=Roseobacter sp. HKCCD9026 TaxID=2690536 RepID=UPI001491EA0A|nr:response regulator [Roseobacter sp. HKCCD9026]NOB66087.1 response regulator [Roseobacter sp. HKCCD9026]
MKILAVDDDPEFLVLFEDALSNMGYSNVTFAESGAEALDLISKAQIPFDCFILDIQMPGMDGIELCEAIRSMPEYDKAPIVMNTIMSDRAHIDRAFAAGATDYLTKPIDEIEINTRLGVLHTLVRERIRTQHAINHGGADVFAKPSYRFADQIPMQRVAGTIEYLAMENYLKTLGVFRALSTKAVGFHVINGQQLFDEAGASIFSEVMIDVATCISDCLKTHSRMISYAGKGDFVCLLSRVEAVDSFQLGEELRMSIAEFGHIYDELNIHPPMVTVGPAVGCKALHMASPTRILDEAILNARSAARHFTGFAESLAR